DFDFNAIELSATHWTQSNPSSAASRTGFRVASVVPEPSTALLLGLGLATGALFQRSRRSERRTAPGSLQSLAPPPRQG
ncbi:MAG: PEP-CTERM sorting domain-containing protein, partial [bacterium]|nr:PEP-CTERM sorting domain-containing protein [bacterium]